MQKILKYKNTILAASVLLVAISTVLMLVFGFRLGIDFTSGSLWQLRIPNTTAEEVRQFFFENLGEEQATVSYDSGADVYAVTLGELTDQERQDNLAVLARRFGEGVESVDFWNVSPSVSHDLRTKSFWAIGLVLLGISLYIAFAFRKVSEPIRSWKYGAITLITLVHDVAIPAGVFAVLGATRSVTVDTNFIVAMLFVMGFSVHDTIVVFDRIRENILHFKEQSKKEPNLEEIVDKSITETLARSINTSLTLIVILVALFFLGPVSIKFFVLAILIGTIAGTYSSIFFASPLLILAQRFSRHPQG